MHKSEDAGLLLYGTLLSALIALIAFAFLMAEKSLTHVFWENNWIHHHVGLIYKAVFIFGGASVVYFLKQKWGRLPRTSHELMHELKTNQTVDYHHTWRNIVLSLLILILGAGVGPEAPLLGVVIAYSVWQADKLRYLQKNRTQFEALSFKEKLTQLLHPQKYVLPYPSEENHSENKRRQLFFIINGLIIFMILMNMTEQPSFITKLGDSQWNVNEVLLLLPLMAYGFLFGQGYRWVKQRVKTVGSSIQISQRTKVFLGASAIFIIALFAPALLFSGQHSMHLVLELGLELPVFSLMMLSILKLVFLDVCIGTGWTGGDIFPVTFASVLQGFAIAQLFPQYDTLFVVLVISLSIAATLLQNEWLAGIFVAFFFPLNLWPIALGLILLFRMMKKIPFFKMHASNASHS